MRSWRPAFLASLVFAGLLLSPLTGQEQPGGAAKFQGEEVSVGYVLVPVIVRKASGGYANNLGQKDFRLLVDGRPVAMDSFEKRAEAPTSVIFLQDLSGSMGTGGKLEMSREAVRYFLGRAQAGDEFALGTFAGGDRTVEVRFTPDVATVRKAIAGWQAYGTTALQDAVAWVPDISQAGHNPKRFVILITDGIDNASSLTAAEAREVVRRAQLPVYVLGLGSGSPFAVTPEGKKIFRYADVLNLLAYETGGRYYPLSDENDLKQALTAIADDLRHEYVLGFATGGGSSRYRELTVEVEGRNRSVLFRKGYQGPPPSGFLMGGSRQGGWR
ncbi:MAG TPA: VWA domain-containing protein [Thermoanaerobaculia bacterium]|nr:VWA domain-containing protein [Thermoanaerobaculia bacterium]